MATKKTVRLMNMAVFKKVHSLCVTERLTPASGSTARETVMALNSGPMVADTRDSGAMIKLMAKAS